LEKNSEKYSDSDREKKEEEENRMKINNIK